MGDSPKTGIGKSAGLFVALIFMVQLSAPLCFSQEPAGIPSSVKSPQDLEKWLSGFKSQMQLPDVPQTVKEMLNTRAGDCDDFATLASKALAGLGISSTVLVIKFKDANIRHAICLWKNESGNYDFFSTKKLVHTGEKNVDVVLKRYYPSSESVSALDIRERAAF
jgi:predicted transglutaminase-like cysteine proteinase